MIVRSKNDVLEIENNQLRARNNLLSQKIS